MTFWEAGEQVAVALLWVVPAVVAIVLLILLISDADNEEQRRRWWPLIVTAWLALLWLCATTAYWLIERR